MNCIKLNKVTGTGLAILAITVIASVACGAPLSPTTYDPQVSLAPLVEEVSSAVVNIKTTTRVRVSGAFGPENLFEFFLGRRNGRGGGSGPREREHTRQSAGSGFIIDKEGLVVTNHHVVANADEIQVQLSDERTFRAILVGSDERTDVALLRLEKAGKLPTVEFGDSDDLRVGDRVVAIGNPFGLDHTVTSGIVSAKERVIGAGPYDDFIQTDASINPGNSGGPLFNLGGQVVGINTAIVPRGQGIGFAIPANLARRMIDSLRMNGKVVRGWLGIVPQPMDEQLAGAFGAGTEGALVANVQPGSPAEDAGLKAGDIIVKVGRKRLVHGRDIYTLVADLQPGKKTSFMVLRDGKKKKLQVVVGRRPDEGEEEPPKSARSKKGVQSSPGVRVSPIDDQTRARLGAKDVDGGVLVTGTRSGSPVGKILRAGDIIAEVNRERIRDVAGFEEETRNLKEGDDLLLLIFRQGAWIYKIVRL